MVEPLARQHLFLLLVLSSFSSLMTAQLVFHPLTSSWYCRLAYVLYGVLKELSLAGL